MIQEWFHDNIFLLIKADIEMNPMSIFTQYVKMVAYDSSTRKIPEPTQNWKQ